MALVAIVVVVVSALAVVVRSADAATCAVVAARSSSDRDAASGAAKATDGNVATAWRSATSPGAAASQWLEFDVASGSDPVRALKIRPRSVIIFGTYGFPVDWKTQRASSVLRDDVGFPNPTAGQDLFLPLTSVVASGEPIRLAASTLRLTNAGGYAFELAEVTPLCDAGYGNLQYLGNNGGTQVRVDGVGSGAFNETKLKTWHHDVRRPLIAPYTTGPRQNIYAANVGKDGATWIVYFHGWDGFETDELDTILLTETTDFVTFSPHVKIIRPTAEVPEVGNPGVVRVAPDRFVMHLTTLPTLDLPWKGRTGVAYSADGRTWTPFDFTRDYWIEIAGYPYETANINSGKVTLYEDGVFHHLFADIDQVNNPPLGTKVFYANSTDPDAKALVYRGVAQPSPTACQLPNDLRRFGAGASKRYLMLSICNTAHVFFNLSDRVDSFPAPQVLFTPPTDAPQKIVSAGLVEDGERIYGVLWGAITSATSLDGKIYASWLQKEVGLLSPAGARLDAGNAADGAGTAIVKLAANQTILTGALRVSDTDGTTALLDLPGLTVRPGDRFIFNA